MTNRPKATKPRCDKMQITDTTCKTTEKEMPYDNEFATEGDRKRRFFTANYFQANYHVHKQKGKLTLMKSYVFAAISDHMRRFLLQIFTGSIQNQNRRRLMLGYNEVKRASEGSGRDSFQQYSIVKKTKRARRSKCKAVFKRQQRKQRCRHVFIRFKQTLYQAQPEQQACQ
ncbi:hypothetical protein TNCV_2087551 [Trichonephila clavipes]|nr:hypothetical protein TNCV_2087551 [Trichonephila clavipes]